METSPRPGHPPDLRKIGIHPDFWYPVAWSKDLKPGQTLAASFAGEPIALARTKTGAAFALEDRCAHRQVPLSQGVVCGEVLNCCYHAWTYDKTGKCINVPYLAKDQPMPQGVRGYPCREAYGLIWIFPGGPEKEREAKFPDLSAPADPRYKTRRLDRVIQCHYSFMHENLMDMNHQYLHRSLMGGIRPNLLDAGGGDGWYQALYTFDRVSGAQSLGEKFMIGRTAEAPTVHEHDVMTVRTAYPYQTLTFCRADSREPALDLWLCYVPVDREQRVNRSFGLMCVRKPGTPGLIHLFWPFICWFTEGIFMQDRKIVEREQAAHDAQGADWNQEIFPVIQGLRDLLARRGVALK